MILLSQRVNLFEMMTSEKKIEVISCFVFLNNLKNLKHYLELTDWLWNYVFYYVQLVILLQWRKTIMNRNKIREILLISKVKEKFFVILQAMFVKSQFLTHFNTKQHLYVNFNVFKQHSFNCIIYYIKTASENKNFNKIL